MGLETHLDGSAGRLAENHLWIWLAFCQLIRERCQLLAFSQPRCGLLCRYLEYPLDGFADNWVPILVVGGVMVCPSQHALRDPKVERPDLDLDRGRPGGVTARRLRSAAKGRCMVRGHGDRRPKSAAERGTDSPCLSSKDHA